MFTTEHFIWIALCAVFVSGMCCLSVKKRFSLKRAGIDHDGDLCPQRDQ